MPGPGSGGGYICCDMMRRRVVGPEEVKDARRKPESAAKAGPDQIYGSILKVGRKGKETKNGSETLGTAVEKQSLKLDGQR